MISVVVPAYNAADTLDECLQGLLDQSIPRSCYEVIVVDDGSMDHTLDVAAAYGVQGVRVVHHQQNQGAGSARNTGVACAQGDLVLFIDSDCVPRSEWVQIMAEAFQDPEVVGIKGGYLTRQTSLVPRFTQAEYEDRYDRMLGQERINSVDTASAAYRRDVFIQNGGFDPSFRFLEDHEFSFRLAEKGYKLIYVPEAQVYHRHNNNVLQYLERKFGIGVWKARVVQRYPERLASDSHTPPVLKLQLLLLMLAGPLLLAGLLLGLAGVTWWTWFAAAGLVAGLLFLASGVPFWLKVLRRDPPVALIVPPMLVVRALALGVGYAIGSLRFLRVEPENKPLLGAHHRFLKRIADLVGASLGLLISAPLALVIAVAVKLDSPGPAFYVQDRVGANGRTFRLIKFRTMIENADQPVEDLANLESLDDPACKLREDPRVTRVGRFLRRTSLDELPQFVNVLKGEMSLVGPRPEEVGIVKLYDDRQRRRLAVKPGMTGPMQVNGGRNLTLTERLELELDYVEHYSLHRDLDILLRTLPAVVRGQGAY